MKPTDEHDDDLESEVAEGAAIEREQYEEADDEEVISSADLTTPSEQAQRSSIEGELGEKSEEESEDEASDTI